MIKIEEIDEEIEKDFTADDYWHKRFLIMYKLCKNQDIIEFYKIAGIEKFVQMCIRIQIKALSITNIFFPTKKEIEEICLNIFMEIQDYVIDSIIKKNVDWRILKFFSIEIDEMDYFKIIKKRNYKTYKI